MNTIVDGFRWFEAIGLWRNRVGAAGKEGNIKMMIIASVAESRRGKQMATKWNPNSKGE